MAGFDGVQQDAAAERMALLMEELGEALQAMGKVVRHGWLSVDPTKKQEDQTTNVNDLIRELGHVNAAMVLMDQAGDLNGDGIYEAARTKLASVQKWLHCPENIEAARRALEEL